MPELITAYKGNYYCVEMTKVGTSGATQREQRTSPNTGWQNSLFANTSGAFCSQWVTTQEDSVDWDPNYATTTASTTVEQSLERTADIQEIGLFNNALFFLLVVFFITAFFFFNLMKDK